MPTLRNLGSLLVLSPHLDDAVLSCGELLAAHPGSVVITVFAGVPGMSVRTPWDEQCGFNDARAAVAVRRAEDEAALATLQARPRHLDFLDAQYGGADSPETLCRALVPLLDREAETAGTILFPLGLFHSDHERLHAAALQLRPADRAARPARRWLAYEDVPYRAIAGRVQQRLASLQAEGLMATPVRLPPSPVQAASLKQRALAAYASQWPALGEGGQDDALAPERAWLIDDAQAQDATSRDHPAGGAHG